MNLDVNLEVDKTNLLCLKHNKFKVCDISILLYIVLSFFIQAFTHILEANSLLIISFLLATLIIIYTGIQHASIWLNSRVIKINVLWIIALMMILFNYTRTQFEENNYLNNLVSLFSFLLGISLLIFSEKNSSNFRIANKAITFFAFFYAISVWVQILSPTIYKHFLAYLPEETMLNITE